MTILTMMQTVCKETGWADPPDVVINSTDKSIIQLRIMAEKALRQCRRNFPWRELVREGSITLATSTASYALPGDFDHEFYDSLWNRDGNDRVYGPLTPSEWQMQKGASLATGISQFYALRGRADNQFFIDPTPGSGDNGNVVYFDYQAKTTIRPATFATGTEFSAGDYTWYNGVIYRTTSGGTSNGATPAADAGVTDWTAYTSTYDTFVKDTDCALLEEDLVEIGIKALFKKEKRLDGFDEDMADWEEAMRIGAARSMSARNLNLDGRNARSWPNIADTGYNNYGA